MSEKPPSVWPEGGAGGDRLEAARLSLPLRTFADWLKFKNPEAPAVRREAEEDWGR
jgi:hypothetical protein